MDWKDVWCHIKTYGGAAAVGFGMVATVPFAIAALGFKSAGIAAGSIAAKMMSASAVANGGGVVAGGVVATLQSVGAAGFGLGAKTAIGTGAGVIYQWAVGGRNNKDCEYKTEDSDRK